MAPELVALFGQAVALHQAGRLTEAEPLYREVLRAQPRHVDALHLLGVIHYQRGEYEEALRRMDAALKLNPKVAPVHNNRGSVLKDLGCPREALASYDRAIALKPDYVDAFYNRGNVQRLLARSEEAVASYDRAIALRPIHPDALNNRGSALKDLKRLTEAVASFDQAIGLKPDYAEAWYNRGNALHELKRFEEALESYGRAIALRPNFVEVLKNRGNTLKELRRFDQALADYACAIAVKSDDADAFFNRGAVLAETGRTLDALDSYGNAVALDPRHAEALFYSGGQLKVLGRLDEAIGKLEAALAIKPSLDQLKGLHLHVQMHLCDWTDFDGRCAELNEAVAAGTVTNPFHLLAYASTPQLQRTCARNFAAAKYPSSPEPIWRGERYGHQRIRVAYLSSDFRDHPVAQLILGLFKHHDRSRFETIAISSGPDQPSAMRQAVKAGCDRFIDGDKMSDREVAELMRELEVDIAVDLNGYTDGARPGVFARRPAPVQVNYLGYAGTLWRDYCDYVIADRFVIPEDAHSQYAEKVVYLPETFMVNDSGRKISDTQPSRSQAGLPETGFVFCCFNSGYKITPDLFDVWMRLLHEIEDSVLWLSSASGTAPTNLRHEAERRGGAGDRLLFAPKVALSQDHLARLGLADLFLDTLYYNAHASAADALWAGVPVLTCPGETFASRVAGSLLGAIGLPELITTSLADYEALALRLAREPAQLAALRQKLARHRTSRPLFDTARFARHIEAAFRVMRDRAEQGAPPQAFAVAPIAHARS